MRIEMRREYPFGTCVATLTDLEKGWESDDALFLQLIQIRLKMTLREFLSQYRPNKIEARAILLAEAMKAEITHMDLSDVAKREPDVIY